MDCEERLRMRSVKLGGTLGMVLGLTVMPWGRPVHSVLGVACRWAGWKARWRSLVCP